MALGFARIHRRIGAFEHGGGRVEWAKKRNAGRGADRERRGAPAHRLGGVDGALERSRSWRRRRSRRHSDNSTTNSSPPMRATTSEARTYIAHERRRRTAFEHQHQPALWPVGDQRSPAEAVEIDDRSSAALVPCSASHRRASACSSRIETAAVDACRSADRRRPGPRAPECRASAESRSCAASASTSAAAALTTSATAAVAACRPRRRRRACRLGRAATAAGRPDTLAWRAGFAFFGVMSPPPPPRPSFGEIGRQNTAPAGFRRHRSQGGGPVSAGIVEEVSRMATDCRIVTWPGRSPAAGFAEYVENRRRQRSRRTHAPVSRNSADCRAVRARLPEKRRMAVHQLIRRP